MAMEIPSNVISASVREFARISGLGESTVWAMIHDGRLESVAIGRRRLVLIESFRKLIEQQRAAPPRDARRNSTVPALGSKKANPNPSSAASPDIPHKRKRGRPRKLLPVE
jgi:excisionase family DNA binding protein